MDNQSQGQTIPYLLHPSQFPAGIIEPRMLVAASSRAKGDLYYSNGSDFIQLPVGTTGQVLTITSGAAPAWKTPGIVGNTIVGTVASQVVQSGWSFITSDGVTKRYDKSITFGTAYTSAPLVIVGVLGYKSSDPTNITDFLGVAASVGDVSISAFAFLISTTGFTAEIETPVNIANGARIGFSWLTIGI